MLIFMKHITKYMTMIYITLLQLQGEYYLIGKTGF